MTRPSKAESARLVLNLFPIQPQRLQRGPVVHREQNRVVAQLVLVVVPAPRRDDEDVALRPLEALAVDDRRAFAAEDLVDGRADVAVALRLEPGREELQLARE